MKTQNKKFVYGHNFFKYCNLSKSVQCPYNEQFVNKPRKNVINNKTFNIFIEFF